MTEDLSAAGPRVISARSARIQARLFNIGNIIAMLPGVIIAPYMLWGGAVGKITSILMFVFMIVPPILWFGASMVIYALARHHPNPRVGHYTQHAAYRFYGMFGVVIPVGTFYGTDWRLWIITGGVAALVIIPWSLIDLVRIGREQWQDTVAPAQEEVLPHG